MLRQGYWSVDEVREHPTRSGHAVLTSSSRRERLSELSGSVDVGAVLDGQDADSWALASGGAHPVMHDAAARTVLTKRGTR
jgi:hypothetical protein